MSEAIKSTSHDAFYALLIEAKVDVYVFLINGIKLNGKIVRADRYCIQLTRGSSSQVIYKHTISTVMPPPDFDWERFNA